MQVADLISRQDSRLFDVARMIGNYLIVLMHAWAASQYCIKTSYEYNFWNFICNSFAACAMPAFFFISGYMIMCGLSTVTYTSKLVRRVKRILIPLLVWNISFVVFYLIMSVYVPRLALRVESMHLKTFSGLVTGIVGIFNRPIDSPLWYLRTIFVYAVFSLPILHVLRWGYGFVLYLIPVIVLVVSDLTACGEILKFSYPAYSMATFIAGCHCSYSKISIRRMFGSTLWFLTTVIGLVIFHLWFVSNLGEYDIWRDIGFVLLTPLPFKIAALILNVIPEPDCKAFEFARRSQFFVYAGHFFFCSIMLHTFAPKILGAFGNGFGVLTGLIIFFCTMGLSVTLLAYKIGKMSMGRWFGIWDGSL